MKNLIMGELRAYALMLVAITAFASSVIAAPFDTGAFRSEQSMYFAVSPQMVGSANGDALTFAWQNYDGGNPTVAKLSQFTRSSNGFTKVWEKDMPLARLVGMATDGSNFYVVSALNEDLSSDMDARDFRPNLLMMNKFDNKGNQIWQRDLNNSTYFGASNSSAVFSPMAAGTGAVSYGAGKIVVTLSSNTLPDANGGGRHQRAQYFVVSADGAGFATAGETSWRHSFDQRLVFDGQDFIFMDLGDAGWYMPGAGITVRKIRPTAAGADLIGDMENKQGVYIYARQAETANNQNFSFTSLGDLEMGANGYLSVFTSEKNNPSATRNGFNAPVTEPRNLGFVHVTRNFETVRDGSWDGRATLGNTIIQNSDPSKINITRNVVDSSGSTINFERPQNPNKTITQTGVVWLTSLPAGTSAERPKLIKLSSGRFAALWEEWSYTGSGSNLTYRATKSMIIDEQGRTLLGPVTLDARLNPSGADKVFLLDGKAAWMRGEGASGKFTLYTVDTNLALTSTSIDPSGAVIPVNRDRLKANEMLKPGERLVSKNGRFTLDYQTDSNLVIYTVDRKFIWESRTRGAAGRAIMQSDGNFAIYAADGRFLWNTGTTTAMSELVLQDNGNLVVITPTGAQIWSSNSAQTRDRLFAGDMLLPDEKLWSYDGRFYLHYQNDGNLALYTVDKRFLWESRTGHRTPGKAIMQSDGNFVIYGADGSFHWNTGPTAPDSFFVVQSDGNMIIYSPDGVAKWWSHTRQP